MESRPGAAALRRLLHARTRPASALLALAALGWTMTLLPAGCGDGDAPASASSGSASAWTGDPVVSTRYGAVRGLEDRADTWVWPAIPFARPPVGALRWKAPLEPESWEGVRETHRFASACTQYLPVGDGLIGCEDCLYLNVWRPRTGERKLPVYFWIHGGGNCVGSAVVADDYNGANLADRSNLVVVSMNYRLGPMGWLTHPALRSGAPGGELDDSGNYGTLDLIRALTWVRDNIQAFGGDPERVMIVGESAGAINVLSLLVSPPAAGLFHKAMAESGGPFTSSVEEGEQGAHDLILRLLIRDGLATDTAEAEARLRGMSPAEIESYLRSKTEDEIMRGYEAVAFGMLDLPYLFEDGVVLPREGFQALETGAYPNKVPVIVGSNKEELKLFLFADPFFEGKDDLYQVVAYYGSDTWKAFGVDEIARSLRSNADQPEVRAYQFLWGAGGETGESELPDPWGFRLGCFHALEVPFFFGNESLFGFLQLLLFTEENRPGREALTSAMMRYVARFAHTGDPNDESSGLPEWAPWSNEEGGPKCILFDVDESQQIDVRMSAVELTQSGVRERMGAEVPEPLYSQAVDYLEGFWLGSAPGQ
ncbi:MAG: carboxylesterase family protein [bacterium]